MEKEKITQLKYMKVERGLLLGILRLVIAKKNSGYFYKFPLMKDIATYFLNSRQEIMLTKTTVHARIVMISFIIEVRLKGVHSFFSLIRQSCDKNVRRSLKYLRQKLIFQNNNESETKMFKKEIISV